MLGQDPKIDKVSLGALFRPLEDAGLVLERQGPIDTVTINHLGFDSRKVGPNGLFVAIRGETTDGHLFIEKTVQNGANAIVCEVVPEVVHGQASGTTLIRVSNTRAALAHLAATFYGNPSHALRLVGITGTNGKTTTSFLVHHLLTHLGEPTGLIGTIAYRMGNFEMEAPLTTPDALTINQLLRRMVEAGCTACAMEVSSHALAQDRVEALRFAVGVFTNLTHDHLDYHGTFDAYQAAKKRLFDHLPPGATALYNADDAAGRRMVNDTPAQKLSYGQTPAADLKMKILGNRLDGLHLQIDGQQRTFRLVGAFNAYNLTAAYGVGRALGYEADAVLDVLATAPPVQGRFEQLRFASGRTVIVDFSHTPDALENVLTTIRSTKSDPGALWCVFGCGGDRDPAKRPVMGAIAERYADHVIVTSDNPRTEDPQAILDDIRAGFQHPERATWLVDRREAIRYAARHAGPGDVVLIAGKGHEPYQIIGTEKRTFDDREEANIYFGAQRINE